VSDPIDDILRAAGAADLARLRVATLLGFDLGWIDTGVDPSDPKKKRRVWKGDGKDGDTGTRKQIRMPGTGRARKDGHKTTTGDEVRPPNRTNTPVNPVDTPQGIDTTPKPAGEVEAEQANFVKRPKKQAERDSLTKPLRELLNQTEQFARDNGLADGQNYYQPRSGAHEGIARLLAGVGGLGRPLSDAEYNATYQAVIRSITKYRQEVERAVERKREREEEAARNPQPEEPLLDIPPGERLALVNRMLVTERDRFQRMPSWGSWFTTQAEEVAREILRENPELAKDYPELAEKYGQKDLGFTLASPDPEPPARTAAEVEADVNSVLVVLEKEQGELGAAIRKELRAALESAESLPGMLASVRDVIDRNRPALVRMLAGARAAAGLLAMARLGEAVPAVAEPAAAEVQVQAEAVGRRTLPLVREAAAQLQARRLLLPPEVQAKIDRAEADAEESARLQAEATQQALRDGLVDTLTGGGTLEDFRGAIKQVLEEKSFLAERHVENVFRSNVMEAYSRGQAELVQADPQVASLYPYAAYHATHDDRTREQHLALETLGLDGTNVYRVDDPVFQTFRPPWSFNCRCTWTPLTVRQAAAKGVQEAKTWLESGRPPGVPQHVPAPAFGPDKDFVRELALADVLATLGFDLGWTDTGVDPSDPKGKRRVWKGTPPDSGTRRQISKPGTGRSRKADEGEAAKEPARPGGEGGRGGSSPSLSGGVARGGRQAEGKDAEARPAARPKLTPQQQAAADVKRVVGSVLQNAGVGHLTRQELVWLAGLLKSDPAGLDAYGRSIGVDLRPGRVKSIREMIAPRLEQIAAQEKATAKVKAAVAGDGKSRAAASAVASLAENDRGLQARVATLRDAAWEAELEIREATYTTGDDPPPELARKAARLADEADKLADAARKWRADQRNQVARMLAPGRGAGAIKAKISPDATPEIRRGIEDALKWLNAFVGRDLEVEFGYSSGTRSYYDPETGKVVLGTADVSVIAHETAHAIENKYPEVQQAMQDFLDYRCGDEPPRDMGHMGMPGEYGRVDNFEKVFGLEAPYVGKIYAGGHTELLSMSVGLLATNPAHFAEADPELFAFIVGVLQGRIPTRG